MCLRDDVFDIMTWQLACAGFDGLKGEGETDEEAPVRAAMLKEWIDMVAKPVIREEAMQQYLVFPVVDTLTLGLYSMVTPGSDTFT